MTQVLCTFEKLTGNYELRKTFFGPRIYVEVQKTTWDTNTGYDDNQWTEYRKLRNDDNIIF